jgi:hypothetical protein
MRVDRCLCSTSRIRLLAVHSVQCKYDCDVSRRLRLLLQLGVMAPEMRQADRLSAGQVGYIITGLKSTKAVRVGDTWHHYKATNVVPLPGFKPAKAMMFAGEPTSSCLLGVRPLESELQIYAFLMCL